MGKDSKLSDVLHILLHIAQADDPVTSETMVKMMRSNPVVIRRILAELRQQALSLPKKGMAAAGSFPVSYTK